jgi:hypothetical protein
MKRAGELSEVIYGRQSKRKVRPPFLQLFRGKRQQVLRRAVRRQRGPIRYYLRLQSSGMQNRRLNTGSVLAGDQTAPQGRTPENKSADV